MSNRIAKCLLLSLLVLSAGAFAQGEIPQVEAPNMTPAAPPAQEEVFLSNSCMTECIERVEGVCGGYQVCIAGMLPFCYCECLGYCFDPN